METIKVAKKMGRPRKANPLTPAQRHARWRAKKKAQKQEMAKLFTKTA